MGSEQSKAEERKQSQGITRDEVNRLLEQQKKDYERKLKEMKIRPSTTNSQPAPVAREATERNVDQIIAQHIQTLVQNAAPSNPVSPHTHQYQSPLRQTALQPSISSTTSSADINQISYSQLRECLQNRGHNVNSPQSNLYPSLDTARVNATANAADQYLNTRFEAKKNAGGVFPTPHSSANDGSVFGGPLNQNIKGYLPTAPPASTVSKNPFTPKASTSRSSKNNDEEVCFNCITCGKKYGLTIYQCSNGHSSCIECKLRENPCGRCRGAINDTRNHTLEAYIAERKTACPYAEHGCILSFKQADIKFHLKECPYSDYDCPLSALFGRCSWRGKISQMASHFDDVHPENRQAMVDTELHHINILDTNHTVHFVEMHPNYFLFHLKVDEAKRYIYMTVQMFGTQISAQKWSYEVHIYNKRESRRKYLYTDICNSHGVSVKDIFAEEKCVTIPQSYAMTFINEGCLTYKFYIKRDCEFKPANNNNRGRGRGGGRGRGRGRGAKAN